MARLKIIIFFFALIFCFGSVAYADYKADIGYFLLQAEVGADLPDGSGVQVSHVEASSNGHWMPDTANDEFSGKIITDVTGDSGYSGHATAVGKLFYGNTTSIAPGIDNISVYEANHWLQDGFLKFLVWDYQPDQCSSRVANHSWIGSASPESNSEILRRLDWVIETDEFIQVAGLPNSSSSIALLSSAFNIIAVGRTDGVHAEGTASVDDIYTGGRTRPDIVVPYGSTSGATPVVAAAVSLLVETGAENPSLSTDPVEQQTQNRNGNVIYNSERSEVVKAALTAGADRFTRNTSTGDITDYRDDPSNRTENGLDSRYGAGQLNIYNSYQIIASSEQNSLEDDLGNQGLVAHYGFDYDPFFGGSEGSNGLASYYLIADDNHTLLCASLVWNIKIDGGDKYAFDGTATLYDLDVYLYDITDGGVVVAFSASSSENTENLFTTLTSGHEYLLQIQAGQGQDDFEWDYALAWQMKSDADSDMVPDEFDNCYMTPNQAQVDTDQDGYGNACDCDLNNDDLVDSFDYELFKAQWLTTGQNEADFNSDNVVDSSDFRIFANHWLLSAPWY